MRLKPKLVGLLLCLCLAQVVCAADSGGVKRALLIGINRYIAVPGLQGSVNDVETMQQILTQRWGFLPRNITVITDQDATRERMLAAITDIVAQSGPEDTLYIHYSGHGSQVQDLNGDEADGLDETLVPADGRTAGVRDIVDDELDVIFSRLRARSAVIVFDSCHSGTATRSIDIRARSVPQDMRIDLYRTGVTGTRTRGITALKKSQYVFFGAVADNEEALDGPVEGTYHGFFTYALARTLMTAGNDASPRAILAGVSRELARIQTTYGRTSMPEPQLEGPADALDRPLFAPLNPSGSVASGAASADTANARLAWLSVEPAGAGKVTLQKGVTLGAVVGSIWAIYPPGEAQFPAGEARAVATVTRVVGKDAEAALAGADFRVESGARAVALMPAPSTARVAVRILDVPSQQRERIERLLRRHISNLDLVGPQQPARFLVDMKGQAVRLLTADGLYEVGHFDAGDESSAADAARIASRSARAAELLSLDNPASQLLVSARVVGRSSVGSRDIQLAAEAATARLHARHPDEPRGADNSLQLAITVSADSYITIVDVDSEGNTNLLFPNGYQHADFHTDGAVRAGAQVLIPDSLQPGNRAGFYWDYSPPRGTDTVRVFASTDLGVATSIRQRIAALQPPSHQAEGPATRAIGDDLDALRADLGQSATRGIKVVADTNPSHSELQAPSGPIDWAATSVTVQVSD
jgi:hypothetical protein